MHCVGNKQRSRTTALLVSLGERTGSLLGLISLSVSDFSIGSVQSHHIYVFCTSSLAPYLEGPICLTDHILSGGLSTRRDLRLEGCFSICLCFSLFLVSVAGSTFFSLPDGLRHLFRDHTPYSILHIPYSMLYVIYDLEGSNAVNPQVRNLFHVGKNLFAVLFGSIKPAASLGNGHFLSLIKCASSPAKPTSACDAPAR